MEGAQSVLPPQRALPTAHEAVLQLGELRLKLLPDLTRARPAPVAPGANARPPRFHLTRPPPAPQRRARWCGAPCWRCGRWRA